MNVEIRPARLLEVEAFYFQPVTPFWAALIDGEVVAMARLVEIGGRVWAYFDVRPMPSAAALRVLRAMRGELIKVNRDVYVHAQTEQAHRLLRFLGFQPTAEVDNGKQVWRWVN